MARRPHGTEAFPRMRSIRALEKCVASPRQLPFRKVIWRQNTFLERYFVLGYLMTMTDTIEATVERMRRNWPEASADQAGRVMALTRNARLIQDADQAALQAFGLIRSEFELLAALRSHAPPHRLTPSDLYDAMLMSSGGMTKLLKGLEARGLVSRPAGDGDRRSRPIELTQTGRDLVERAMPAVQAAEAVPLSTMNDGRA